MVASFQRRNPAETSSFSDFLATVRKRQGKIVSLDRVFKVRRASNSFLRRQLGRPQCADQA